MVLARSYRGKLRKSSVVVDGFLGEIYTQEPHEQEVTLLPTVRDIVSLHTIHVQYS